MIANGVLRAGLLGHVDDPLRPDARIFPPPAEEVVDVAAGFVEFLRADDQVDVGQFVEDRRAPALGHAAEKTDHLVLALVFPAAERFHLADRLLLGHIAHRAGVEQDDIGAFFALHQLVAPAGQVAGDLFGVAHVHLAAIGFDEDGRHKVSILAYGRKISSF